MHHFWVMLYHEIYANKIIKNTHVVSFQYICCVVNTKQCRQSQQRIYRQGVIAGGIAFELTKQR